MTRKFHVTAEQVIPQPSERYAAPSPRGPRTVQLEAVHWDDGTTPRAVAREVLAAPGCGSMLHGIACSCAPGDAERLGVPFTIVFTWRDDAWRMPSHYGAPLQTGAGTQ
jgi:hypothetical protein